MARRRGSPAGSGSQVLGAVGRWCRVVRWGRAVQRCYINVHVRLLARRQRRLLLLLFPFLCFFPSSSILEPAVW